MRTNKAICFTMHGVAVSGGVAIAHAHLVSHATLEVANYALPKQYLPDEIARFDAAVAATRDGLYALRSTIPKNAPSEFCAFIDLHLMILNDATLSEAPKALINEQRCNAEWALHQQMQSLLEQFDQMENIYLRERKGDVIQVVERVLKALMGHPGYIPAPTDRQEASILVAHDLSPADVIQFKQHQFAAFITDGGGATSHTAILARSLNIPSIAALHVARQLIHENDLLIVDGSLGAVIVNPDDQALSEYRLRQHQWEIERKKLKRLKTTRSTTLDGTQIELQANIELPQDVEQVIENGATGIGLFRSEFMFLNRDDLPGEDEQFTAYRKVAEEMHGMPVTIRTLDLGADKQLNGSDYHSANPAMGLRAIRLCLAEPVMFHTQLRAILRASSFGKVRILIPMLSNVSELKQTLHFIDQAKRSLEADNVSFDRDIPVGGMIEIPAAALALDLFAKKLDFMSIGTNDLIQYTLAVDRADDALAHLYDPLHPAVLKLIALTIKCANKAKVPIAVCGEMAGDVSLTRLLIGLGLREFSMQSTQLLSVKQQVLKSSVPEVTKLAQKVVRAHDADKARAALMRLNQL